MSEHTDKIVIKINNGFFIVFDEKRSLEQGTRLMIDSVNKKATYNQEQLTPAELRKIPFDHLKLSPGINDIAILQGSFDNDKPVNAIIEMVFRERYLSI